MDFLSAAEASLEGVSDPEVLALAALDGRVLVTHDLRTMPWHFSDFLLQYSSSPGVFLVSQQIPISEVADEPVLIGAASETGEWKNRIPEVPL